MKPNSYTYRSIQQLVNINLYTSYWDTNTGIVWKKYIIILGVWNYNNWFIIKYNISTLIWFIYNFKQLLIK